MLLRNMRKGLSGLSRNIFVVASGSFLADMATEMLTPILPIFMTQVLGASGSIVGLVDGIAQAVRNVVSGLFGPISDKLRARKSIALAGYALSAVAKPLMGVSTAWEGSAYGARYGSHYDVKTNPLPAGDRYDHALWASIRIGEQESLDRSRQDPSCSRISGPAGRFPPSVVL